MLIRAFTLAGAYVLLLCCLSALGQTTQSNPSIHPTKASPDTDDTIAILEVGAATNWNFSGGAATFAPNLAAECTPSKTGLNWRRSFRIRQSKPTVDKCGCLAVQATGVSSATRWSGMFASPGRMSAR
jgi:hypothetical protein